MIGDAFAYSEKYSTPVLFRPTTRICHACEDIDISEDRVRPPFGGFVKDPRWVIFPRLSYNAHKRINKRNPAIGDDFSSYAHNSVTGGGGWDSLRRDKLRLCCDV
jgi:indolepyruvate ferredoxin oxidoreductase alpha subunit